MNPLKLMGVDERRLKLTRGLRLYQDRHLDTAKLELNPIADHPLAEGVLGQIKTHESQFHARQLAFVLKTLGKDAAGPCSFTETDKLHLTSAIELIEAQMIIDNGTDLKKAIAAAEVNFDPTTKKVWDCFATTQHTAIAELAAAFLETDPALLADNLLGLAELHRQRKHFGTSWALAQISAEYPSTQKRAKELIAYLEGKRTSTEYVLSDMFDHGGTSIAIDLLALAPSVALTRRLSAVAWLANRRALVRVPMTLLAGGALHWGTTKALKGLTGYDGKIMPESLRDFGAELASSTLQNSFALLLANRKLFWGRPAGTRQALAAVEGVEAAKGAEALETATMAPKKLGLAAKVGNASMTFGRAAWWTTKTGLKVGTIGVGDLLLVKTPLHYFDYYNMNQRGLPQYAMKLFPKAREARQAVTETYAASNLYRQYQKRDAGSVKMPNQLPGVDPALDIDVLLTQLDPGLAGDKREAAYAVLAESAAAGKLGLNIRRWVLQKKKLNEWEGANRTFERQGIPLRYDAEGSLCFTDSKEYPCPEAPAKKP